MEEKYSCKICFTSSDLEEDPLISPCKCNSKVHKSCIEMWRRKKIGKNQYYRCEVCLEKYKISIFSNYFNAHIIRFLYFYLSKINYSYFISNILINFTLGYFFSKKYNISSVIDYLIYFFRMYTDGLLLSNFVYLFITTITGIMIVFTNKKLLYWKDTDNVDIRVLYFINLIGIIFPTLNNVLTISSIFVQKFTLNYIIEFNLREINELLSEDYKFNKNLLDILICPEITNEREYNQDIVFQTMIENL